MKVLYPLTLISALALPTYIQAAETTDKTGFAVLLDVGIADIAVDAVGGYQEESDTTTSPALGLSYQFNDNMSVVAYYTNYGTAELFSTTTYINSTSVDITVESETTALSVVGQYMVPLATQGWSIGARLGVTSWDTEFGVAAVSSQASAYEKFGDDSGTALTGGILAEYGLTEKLSLTFSADWFVNKIDGSVEFTDDGADLDMQYGRYAMGLKYAF
jgi:hypothetical protein